MQYKERRTYFYEHCAEAFQLVFLGVLGLGCGGFFNNILYTHLKK